MKTILLMRHADACWSDHQIKDYERPLLKPGADRTREVTDFLAKRKIKPDIIVSSHAKRALETAEIVAKGLDYPHHEILIDTKLYNERLEAISDVILSLPDDKNSAIIIGHNPYITQFANEYLKNKIDYLPTSGVVAISFNTDKWNEVFTSKREVVFIIKDFEE